MAKKRVLIYDSIAPAEQYVTVTNPSLIEANLWELPLLEGAG